MARSREDAESELDGLRKASLAPQPQRP